MSELRGELERTQQENAMLWATVEPSTVKPASRGLRRLAAANARLRGENVVLRAQLANAVEGLKKLDQLATLLVQLSEQQQKSVPSPSNWTGSGEGNGEDDGEDRVIG